MHKCLTPHLSETLVALYAIHILVRNRVEIYFQEKYFYSNIKILYSNIYTEDDKKGPDDPSFKNLWVRVLPTLVHQNSYIH